MICVACCCNGLHPSTGNCEGTRVIFHWDTGVMHELKSFAFMGWCVVLFLRIFGRWIIRMSYGRFCLKVPSEILMFLLSILCDIFVSDISEINFV